MLGISGTTDESNHFNGFLLPRHYKPFCLLFINGMVAVGFFENIKMVRADNEATHNPNIKLGRMRG